MATTAATISNPISRVRLIVTGAVQGVGFRPFVYRLANELGVSGWVGNEHRGVVIEAEAPAEILDRFLRLLKTRQPRSASIRSISRSSLALCGDEGFSIAASTAAGSPRVDILPDLASCDECIEEVFNRNDRRYRYPFTSCTQCGPRWSIINSLPYDRDKTAMDMFPLCPDCLGEYRDPASRRFHHQANACPLCGPQLILYDSQRNKVAIHDDALLHAIAAVQRGCIVALKGLGGFQLLVDAGNREAIGHLRARKHRPAKPLAIMCRDLTQVLEICDINDSERALLASPAAPIVLLKKKAGQNQVVDAVAPDNPYLGVMLPTTVLHHLLLAEAGKPLVVTSGNISGEPICIDDTDAFERLRGIADLFLTHNRPIARPLDDSVAQVVAGNIMLLRRARGYAPSPLDLSDRGNRDKTILATGSYLKNTIAVNMEDRALLSAHIGDLDNAVSRSVFGQRIDGFCRVYQLRPQLIVHDAHPDYPSTQYAVSQNVPTLAVQHHHAHIAACMAEHGLDEKLLGIAWDGIGLGDDNTAWGGEFLLADYRGFERIAGLLPFPLIGGDAAARDARRALLGVLWRLYDGSEQALQGSGCLSLFEKQEATTFLTMLQKNINITQTSSAGRLFDAVAALLNVCKRSRFEGEAAMRLQFAAETAVECPAPVSMPLVRIADSDWIDWRPLIGQLLQQQRAGVDRNQLALLFHRSLVTAIADFCQTQGHSRIILSGGCFQNRLLLTAAIGELEGRGVTVYWPQRVPANDGGIAFGQLAIGYYS